ncbi:hypothetical protein LX73_2430 [Fodinibius salinus]|uniref:Uncharacterized protein n=1 Tax=Fodinibius salinus TaxID=860790 RepID=A0A5D3YI18_9BACT|nr:hypothetical protein [Fodinibius salinus]TYP92179.1 hypothetical protein LX73_2430 [Fodinibius salinus]
MKLSKLLFLVISLAIFSLYGCSDGGPANTNPNITPPSAEEFNNLRAAAWDSLTQTHQFDAANGISFTSENGVDLNVPSGCLTLNGQSASGSATLEYVELFNRSNMLVSNKATMGIDSTGKKRMLISGGSFFMEVTQNGQELEASCNNVQLKIPGNLTGGTDTEMTLWKGNTDNNDNLGWEEEDSTGVAGAGQNLFVENTNYFAFPNDFSPTNVDKFYSDPRPKTTLQVQPPEGYDSENSAVYLSYDGEKNALAQLDTFDENTGIFSEHYGQIPIGLEMHIIFTTEENGQWRYAIKGVTVAEDDLYTFTIADTQLGSKQDLTNAIKNLP